MMVLGEAGKRRVWIGALGAALAVGVGVGVLSGFGPHRAFERLPVKARLSMVAAWHGRWCWVGSTARTEEEGWTVLQCRSGVTLEVRAPLNCEEESLVPMADYSVREGHEVSFYLPSSPALRVRGGARVGAASEFRSLYSRLYRQRFPFLGEDCLSRRPPPALRPGPSASFCI